MKESLKKEWPILVLLLAPFVVSAIIWEQVPDSVPTHFNINGEPDNYGPKWMNLIMLPGIALFTYVVLLLLPYIDPKNQIRANQKPIASIRVITGVFFVGLYTIIILISLNYDLQIDTYLTVALGILFLVLGNYLNSVKPNYFIGIRTPWSLENPTVWKKTHRLGSKIWMIGGILVLLSPLLGIETLLGMSFTLIIIIPMVLIPVIYSYFEYQKIEITDK